MASISALDEKYMMLLQSYKKTKKLIAALEEADLINNQMILYQNNRYMRELHEGHIEEHKINLKKNDEFHKKRDAELANHVELIRRKRKRTRLTVHIAWQRMTRGMRLHGRKSWRWMISARGSPLNTSRALRIPLGWMNKMSRTV